MPRRAAPALAAAAALPLLAGAAPSFTTLGAGTQATAASADGSVVVGQAPGGVFRWTAGGGVEMLAGACPQCSGVALSDDGAVIVSTVADHPGDDNTSAAAVWDGAAWRRVGAGGAVPQPNAAFGVATDGSVVVGLAAVTPNTTSPDAAAVWAANGTSAYQLKSTVTGASSRANCATNGGAIIAGWQDQEDGARLGAIWKGTTQTMLKDAAGRPVGEVLTCSADGSVFTGGGAGEDGNEAWVANASASLVPFPLGLLPGAGIGDRSIAFATNGDGSVVLGTSGFAYSRKAFVWTAAGGIRLLDDELRTKGVPVPANWTNLGTPSALSSDGSVLAGWGVGPSNEPEAWVVSGVSGW